MIESDIVLKEEFESLKRDIITLYRSKGMLASGNFERQARVEIKSTEATTTAILHGSSYAEQLQDGRGKTTGGKGTGPTVFDKIKEWIEVKGIKPIEKKMSISSLAFLITRKIHQEGWKREKHGGVELISSVITEERIQKIISRLALVNIAKITSDIKSLYTELEPTN